MRKKRIACTLFLAALLLLGGMLRAAGAATAVAEGSFVECDTIGLNVTTIAGVNFKVVESTLPLTLSETTVGLGFPCRDKHDVTISGGQPPYAAVSGDPSVVTASVSGSMLTLTVVNAGGPVTVVVTDAVGEKATVSVWVVFADPVAGGDIGIKSYSVSERSVLVLVLNVTDNGVNPPTGFKQEWLVFGAIVSGVQTPFYFLTDADQVVALSDTSDPAAVTFTFDHTTSCQMLSGNFFVPTLGLKKGDTFFYLYAWSPNVLTSFQNASGLTFNNVVILNVK